MLDERSVDPANADVDPAERVRTVHATDERRNDSIPVAETVADDAVVCPGSTAPDGTSTRTATHPACSGRQSRARPHGRRSRNSTSKLPV
nr:hypothetical protein [Halomicroarcula sp. SYNS111]